MILETLLALLLGLTTSAFAQNSSSGAVLGTVTDPTGAVVVKAGVTLTNTATNATVQQLTSTQGQYFVPEVAPGDYQVSVQAAGFKTSQVTSLKVDVNKSYTVDVRVEIGEAAATVEVSASSARVELQTTDSQVGSVVSSAELVRLPTLQRDALNLQGLQPATTPGGSGTNFGPGNTAGARNDQNTVTMDGFDVTEGTAGGQLGTKEVVIGTSVEGVDEFRIDVANPTASFGRSPGASVALVSRGGSNTLHGDAYWYHQESGFNANTWQNNHTALLDNNGNVLSQSTPRTSIHDNRQGGAIGGPIWKDKTFFFGRYENHIFHTGTPVTITIPTPSLRAGILTFPDASGNTVAYNLATATNCGPTQNLACDPRGLGISPSVKALWAALPQTGNNTTVGDGLNTTGYSSTVSLPVTDNDGSFRLDHNFSQKLHFMGRYAYFKETRAGSNAISVIGGNFQSVQTLTTIGTLGGATLDYTISPAMTNTFRFGLINGRNHIGATSPAQAAAALNIPGSATSQSGLQTLIGLGCSGCSSNLTQTPIDNSINQARTQIFTNPVKQIGDDFFWTKGKHNMVFGTNIEITPFNIKHDDRLSTVTTPSSTIGTGNGVSVAAADRPPTCSSTITTNCIPSALVSNYNNFYAATLGLLNSTNFVAARDVNLNPLPAGSLLVGNFTSHAPDFYGQDTWRLTQSLTLTYGLNYGWQSSPVEQNGLVSVLSDPTTGAPISANAYIASRHSAALAGQIFNPSLGFIPVRQSKSGIYNTDYGDVAPRVAAAWNPSASNRVFGRLFGDKKTVIRGGFGIVYDRSNQVVNFLASDLSGGFSQGLAAALPLCNASGTPGANCNPASSNFALKAFRVGQDGNIVLPTVNPLTSPIVFPSFPAAGFETIAVTNDPNHKEGRNYVVDFSIQRELGKDFLVEAGFIGRYARHLPTAIDLNTIDINLTDPASKQTFAQAFDATAAAVRTGTGSLDQPFWTNMLGAGAGSFMVNGVGIGPNFQNGDVATVSLVIDQLIGLGLFPGKQFNNRQAEVANALNNDLGISNYNAGFLTVRKRTSYGFTFDLNYTFSKSLANTLSANQNNIATLDPFDTSLQYGPFGFNRTHILNATYDYQLPFGGSHRLRSSSSIVDKLIGGWYNSGVVVIGSGVPTFVTSGANDGSLLGDTLGLFATSSVSTGVNHGVNGASTAGGVAFNGNPTNCKTDKNGVKFNCGTGINFFADPAAAAKAFRPSLLASDFAPGSNGMGTWLNGFGYWNMDMRLGKETSITERVKLDLSLDALNVFNHANLATPTSTSGLNITNPANFGVVNAVQTLAGHSSSSRYLSIGARFTF